MDVFGKDRDGRNLLRYWCCINNDRNLVKVLSLSPDKSTAMGLINYGHVRRMINKKVQIIIGGGRSLNLACGVGRVDKECSSDLHEFLLHKMLVKGIPRTPIILSAALVSSNRS